MSMMTCTDVSRRLLVAFLKNSVVSLALSCRVFFHNTKFPNFTLYEIFPVYEYYSMKFINFIVI